MIQSIKFVSRGDISTHDLFEVTSPCGRVTEHYRFEVEKSRDVYQSLVALHDDALASELRSCKTCRFYLDHGDGVDDCDHDNGEGCCNTDGLPEWQPSSELRKTESEAKDG